MKAAMQKKFYGLILFLICSSLALSQTSEQRQMLKLAKEEQNIETRIDLLEQLVSADENYVEALVELGKAYYQNKEYKKAEETTLKGYYVNPNGTEQYLKISMLHTIALSYEKQKMYKEGEESLRGAIGLALDKDKQAELRADLARNLELQERFKEALEQAQIALEADPHHNIKYVYLNNRIERKIELLNVYNQGVELEKQGDYNKAMELYSNIFQELGKNFLDIEAKLAGVEKQLTRQRNSTILETVYIKARDHEKAGRIKAAIDLYQNIVDEGGFNDASTRLANLSRESNLENQEMQLESLYNKGKNAMRNSNFMEASFAFEEIGTIDPNYKDVQASLREIERRLSETQRETLLARYYGEGRAAIGRDDYKHALIAFRKVRNIDPNYEDVAQLLKKTQQEIGNSTTANLPSLQDINFSELDSLYVSAQRAVGEATWKEAIVLLEKVMIIHPQYKKADSLLMHSKEQLFGEQPDSEKEAGNGFLISFVIVSIIIVPGLAYAVASPAVRARYYLLRNNYDAAARIHERILDKYPNRINVYPALAKIYLETGRTDEQAIKIFKMIMQLNLTPEYHAQISQVLMQSYLSDGQADDADAINMLEEALADEFKKKDSQ